MAIAIRIDATKTSLKRLVDKYTKADRPAIRVRCPESTCQQEYVVYHEPSMDKVQLCEGLAPYLRRDHPKHPVLYEIPEPTLDGDSKNADAIRARLLYRRIQVTSTRVRDVMTEHPICCVPSDTVQHVASLMRDEDVGCLPVVDISRRLVGIVTDRDVCCRATADGVDPKATTIEPYITHSIVTCVPNDEFKHCLELIRKHGIRRVPVVDEDGCCIGIVALSDAPDSSRIKVEKEFVRSIRSTLKKHGI